MIFPHSFLNIHVVQNEDGEILHHKFNHLCSKTICVVVLRCTLQGAPVNRIHVVLESAIFFCVALCFGPSSTDGLTAHVNTFTPPKNRTSCAAEDFPAEDLLRM